jgi:AraC family transcriptional activator of pobA
MDKQLNEQYPAYYPEPYATDKGTAELLFVRSESFRDHNGLFNWMPLHAPNTVFQLFFITAGCVDVRTAESTIHLPAPGIIVIPPGHVPALTYNPEVSGHVLTLDTSWLEGVLQPDIHLLRNFNLPVCLGGAASFEQIMTLVNEIDAEIFNSRGGRQFAVQSLTGLLFVRLNRSYAQAHLQKARVGLNEKYFHAFRESYTRSQLFSKSIPDFAKELCISTVHLNRVCHTVAGRSASLLLQEHAVAAAKKLLAHTSYSISEIAYQLNFTDPGYFARLFKKLTGRTPVAFRKELT